jgi:hypothetical protein
VAAEPPAGVGGQAAGRAQHRALAIGQDRPGSPYPEVADGETMNRTQANLAVVQLKAFEEARRARQEARL